MRLSFGARNLGSRGHRVAGERRLGGDRGRAVAEHPGRRQRVRRARARGRRDDPASVYDVLEQAAAAHGAVELVVNAAAAYGGERSGPFGGGPIAEADLDGFRPWAAAPARAAFSFLSAGGRFAIAQGRAATLVQVTGGSARRALPGRGLWAADRSAYERSPTRPRSSCAPRGIQVTLLIVDAGIQPLDGYAPRRPRRRPWPTPAGSPMPSSSWPIRTRAPRRTSSSSPRSPRTGRPDSMSCAGGATPRAGRTRSGGRRAHPCERLQVTLTATTAAAPRWRRLCGRSRARRRARPSAVWTDRSVATSMERSRSITQSASAAAVGKRPANTQPRRHTADAPQGPQTAEAAFRSGASAVLQAMTWSSSVCSAATL